MRCYRTLQVDTGGCITPSDVQSESQARHVIASSHGTSCVSYLLSLPVLPLPAHTRRQNRGQNSVRGGRTAPVEPRLRQDRVGTGQGQTGRCSASGTRAGSRQQAGGRGPDGRAARAPAAELPSRPGRHSTERPYRAGRDAARRRVTLCAAGESQAAAPRTGTPLAALSPHEGRHWQRDRMEGRDAREKGEVMRLRRPNGGHARQARHDTQGRSGGAPVRCEK